MDLLDYDSEVALKCCWMCWKNHNNEYIMSVSVYWEIAAWMKNSEQK
jgi:hypothetical protein